MAKAFNILGLFRTGFVLSIFLITEFKKEGDVLCFFHKTFLFLILKLYVNK